jgi:hypothetical protein
LQKEEKALMQVDPPAVNAVNTSVGFCASGRFSGWTKDTFKCIPGLVHKSALTNKCRFLVIGSSNVGFDEIENAGTLNIPIVGETFLNAWRAAVLRQEDTSLLLMNIHEHVVSPGEQGPSVECVGF